MSKNGKSALISKSLVPLSKRMHSDLQILPYHFIELFIYFDNFIENDVSISKDSFITANSSLSQSDSFEDEEIDALSASIFGKQRWDISDCVESCDLFKANSNKRRYRSK